ncbi:MAG: hypothetical protein KDB01_16165 [Planctomycetaceae bacterium]|nr:hypothetical protein [Planctomycetaceae bacterium]
MNNTLFDGLEPEKIEKKIAAESAEIYTTRDRWGLVRGADIPRNLRHLLLILQHYQGNNDSAWCKRSALADELGIKVDVVSQLIKALEAIGVVSRIWTHRDGRATREYQIQYATLQSQQRPPIKSEEQADPTLSKSSECTLRESSDWTDPTLSESSGLPLANPQTYSEDPLRVRLYIQQPDNNQITTKSRRAKQSSGEEQSQKQKSTSAADRKLTAFCHAWNTWHSSGIVRSEIRDPDAPGITIINAWNRAQRDPEQRERLNDLPELQSEIEASQDLLLPAGWFDAAGLIGGKNKNHRWYAEQLMAGTYRNKRSASSDRRSIAEDNQEAEHDYQAVIRAMDRYDLDTQADVMQRSVSQRAWATAEAVGLSTLRSRDRFSEAKIRKTYIESWEQYHES